jgi:NADPH-dependent curcumin reductase CurA
MVAEDSNGARLMAHYDLPPVPVSEEKSTDVAIDSSYNSDAPSEWEREIRFPVNDSILTALTLGDKVSVSLVGTVIEASKNESRHGSNKSMSISIESVDVDSSDAIDSDYFMSGFDQGPTRGY